MIWTKKGLLSPFRTLLGLTKTRLDTKAEAAGVFPSVSEPKKTPVRKSLGGKLSWISGPMRDQPRSTACREENGVYSSDQPSEDVPAKSMGWAPLKRAARFVGGYCAVAFLIWTIMASHYRQTDAGVSPVRNAVIPPAAQMQPGGDRKRSPSDRNSAFRPEIKR